MIPLKELEVPTYHPIFKSDQTIKVKTLTCFETIDQILLVVQSILCQGSLPRTTAILILKRIKICHVSLLRGYPSPSPPFSEVLPNRYLQLFSLATPLLALLAGDLPWSLITKRRIKVSMRFLRYQSNDWPPHWW